MFTDKLPRKMAFTTITKRLFGVPAGYKARELRKLVLSASANNEFYKKLYKDIDLQKITPESISKLPFVTKDMLMDSFDDWVSDPEVQFSEVVEIASDSRRFGETYLGKYKICSSSGTSKRMFYSPETMRDFNVETLKGMVAVFPTLKSLLSIALSGRPICYIIPKAAPYSFPMCCEYGVRFFDEDKSHSIDVSLPIDDIVDELNRSNPAALGGYILTLLELCDEIDRGKLTIHPKYIFTTGDTYKPEQRKLIERKFKCRSIGIYASTECGIMAYADTDETYKLDEDIIIELMNKDDEPVKQGEVSDHVYVTCLWRKDTPIIRYRLDDKVLLTKAGKSPRIQPTGRDTPYVVFVKDGCEIKVNGYSILKISEAYNEKVNCQLVVDKYANIGINVTGDEKECLYYKENLMCDLSDYLEKVHGITPVFYDINGPFSILSSGKFSELIYKED